MTTLICDFQSIVGEKIEGYATLTAGKVRPSYSSPAVVVHEPTKQEVTQGQTTFENVNPGDAVITVEWAELTQSATIRFVVPESEEPIYLADCLSADSLTPEEIDLLRWGIRENLSGARELLETAKDLGLTEINGTVEAYFTEAAEILRKALEAANLAEQSLDTIDGKVEATEGVVTDVDQAKQNIQGLLDELATLEQELGDTNADLAGAVGTINTLSPQVNAATQAASAATQKAQNAVNELNTVQTANAAEFITIKQDLDTAVRDAKQATDTLASANQTVANEVQRILGEVDAALDIATSATAQARIANENLETYQYQLGEIQLEQAHIIGQQAEIVGSYEYQLAELERLSSEISSANSELETISGEQSTLVTEMNTQVGSLQELTAAQGAAIGTAKQVADKGVADAAAASNALATYKGINDPKVLAAQTTADTARSEATSKANAARIAAEGVAKELADKAQADAEVAAATEALRVAQEEAAAAKNAASADATAKANAAQAAAENLAKAQAKAAQEAAELTAALDASEKANKAKTDAEAKAATLATAAKDAAATALTGYKNLNDPKVTKAQTDATKGINAAAAAKSAADQAALDATNKSKAARDAAEDYAREAAEAAQAQAEEHAAAEALRVAQAEASAAKASAATDAQAKADEAERLAKIYAEAQAKTAKEGAEATAAKDAATKADNARITAEANAKVLSDKAQQAAATAKARADKGVTDAATAKARADKGVSDAATALAKANEANNKLPAITSDVATAAQTALDAVNALPGIRTDISNAKQQADKGVQDAKEVRDTVYHSVESGASLVAYIPGTETPIWADNMEDAPASENPDGLKEAYIWSSMAGSAMDKFIAVTPGAEYRTTVWLKADKPGSRIYLELRDQDGTHAVQTGAIGGGGLYIIHNMTLPTEWTKYETVLRLRDNAQRVRIAARYHNHANGTERNAVQYVADLRMDPVIPLQGDVEEAQQLADKGVTDAATAKRAADTAQIRADKGVADAATAKQRADKGVADAKAVADQIPDITNKISNLTKEQSTLGSKAQQGIDDAKSIVDIIENTVDIGTSLITYEPGTTTPTWAFDDRSSLIPESELPPGATLGWRSNSPSNPALPKRPVKVSPNVTYRVTAWIKADDPGGAFLIGARSPNGSSEVEDYKTIKGPTGWWSGGANPTSYVLQFRDAPTEWAEYEAHIKFRERAEYIWLSGVTWSYVSSSHTPTTHSIADLRIEPLIPSQAAVDKAQNDALQNHNDILKAQADINTAQGEINANNQAFQTWQKTINDQQAKWNTASENATAALARFAITQVEWNELSAEASNANTKAIASHAALFEGQNKWNTVAAAAIETQANFATKQEEWNAVQKRVNDNFQDWQKAAKEMLSDSGEFQVLQKQFNSDQKKWNATQLLVNDSQKGINALNISTNAAQNDATKALRQIVNTIYPDTDVITMDPDTGTPDWTTHSAISGPFTEADTGRVYYRANRRVNTGGSRVVKTTPDAWYVLSFEARANKAGSRIYIQIGDATGSVSMREVEASHWVTSSTNNSYPIDNQELVTWWREYKVRFKIAEGHDTLRLGTIYWNHTNGSVADAQQWISNLRFYRDIPTQESVDKAQNDALEALNRFAIDQAEWNKVSAEAADALAAGQAAQEILSQKRTRWENGATLAINNLQTSSAKFQQWTNGAALAISNLQTTSDKYKQWTTGASQALDALQRAVGLERMGQSLLTWNYDEDRPNWATGMGNHYTSIPWTETVTYGVSSSFSTMTTPGEFVPIIPNTPYRVKMWLMGSAGSVFVMGVSTPAGEPAPFSGGTFAPRGASSLYLVDYLAMPTTWTLYEGTVEFARGVTAVRIGNRYFNHSRGTAGNQYISGFEFYPDIPTQAQVDDAQNKAIQALNRFAIDQAAWNKVSDDASKALIAGQAAQKVLSDNQTRWIQGADLAIANLQTSSAKFKQWTKAAEDAITAGNTADKAQDNAIAALTEIIGTEGDSGQEGSLTQRISELERIVPEDIAELRGVVSDNTELVWRKHQWARSGNLNIPNTTYFSVTGSAYSLTITARGNWVGEYMLTAVTDRGETLMDWREVTPTSRTWTINRLTNFDGTWERAILDYTITPGEAINLTGKSTAKSTLVAGAYRVLWQHTVPVATTINASLNVGWHAATYDYRYGIRIRAGSGTILAEDGPRTGVGPRTPFGDGYRNMNRNVSNRTIAAGTTIYFEASVSAGGADQRTVRNYTANINYIK